jgi:uncharacterized protein YneF (UPF0154 family)
MISLSQIVMWIVYLLLGGVALGLLWFLIGYIERELGGPPIFYKVVRVIFVVLVVLLCISLLLGFAGHPLVRWG